MKEFLFFVLVLSVFVVMPTRAERLFKIVDEQGNVTYQTAPPTGDDSVEQRDIYGGEGPAEEEIARERATFDYPVTLYAIKKCKPCDQAREQLQKRKVPFDEKDPTSDAKLYQKYTKMVDGTNVPGLSIGENIVADYTEEALGKALDAAGYPPLEKKGEDEEQTDEL
ncbi:MAG: glutaredoxin family protein [Acidiferrobacterales bacterium]